MWGGVGRAAGEIAAFGGDAQATLFAHGVAGVDHEIEQGGLELGGVHAGEGAPALQPRPEVDGLAQGAAQQGLALADQGVEIAGFRPQGLPAREGQQLMCQAFAAPGGGQGGLTHLLAPGGVVGRLEDHVQGADDHGQQIVEVVGHAAGEAADGLHALGVHQVLLGPGFLLQGFGDLFGQQFIDALEVLFGPLGLVDIEGHAHEADDLAMGVQSGAGERAQPAIFP